MTLTVGTDTYISLTDANTYFNNGLHAVDWANGGSKCEPALRMAAKALDRENFLACIATSTQTMAWPRSGVVDSEGREIPNTTVPQAIKDAQCELAYSYLTNDPTEDDSTRNVRRMVADTVTLEYDGRAPTRRLPDIVMALIRPFLVPGSNSSNSIPLVF